MDVDLGRFHGLMTQPKRNDRLIDPAMQKFHRSAVAKSVRRDVLSSEAWTGSRSRSTVFPDQMLECVAAEAISADRGEQRACAVLAIPNPGVDQLGGIAPQGCSAVLAALTQTFDTGFG